MVDFDNKKLGHSFELAVGYNRLYKCTVCNLYCTLIRGKYKQLLSSRWEDMISCDEMVIKQILE